MEVQPFTPEQDQFLQIAQTRAYYQGQREGISLYAHWKDGEQYVGTTGRTLKDALARNLQEEEQAVERLLRLQQV